MSKRINTPEMRAAKVRNNRLQRKQRYAAMMTAKQYCSCGCGSEVVPNSNGCIPKFRPGHSHRGQARNEEWKRKISGSLKRAHAEGKFPYLRDPEYLKRFGNIISAKLTGRHKMSDAGREMIRQRMLGNTNWKKNVGRKLTGKRLQIAIDNITKGRATSQTPEARAKRGRNVSAARTGQKNTGRSAATEDNIRAKYWVVRSPDGVVYDFVNASLWCRNNQHLFSDDRPDSKTPLWLRAFAGFSEMGQTNGRSCSWRGWVLVSIRELEHGEGADLLGRDEAKIVMDATA